MIPSIFPNFVFVFASARASGGGSYDRVRLAAFDAGHMNFSPRASREFAHGLYKELKALALYLN